MVEIKLKALVRDNQGTTHNTDVCVGKQELYNCLYRLQRDLFEAGLIDRIDLQPYVDIFRSMSCRDLDKREGKKQLWQDQMQASLVDYD